MRRVFLLVYLVLWVALCPAQYFPVGTSYYQNFDGLHNGLPVGWHLFTGATDTSFGNADSLLVGTFTWGHSGGGFKNFASANSLSPGASTSDQHNASDRALGVRQTSAVGYNPGVAFGFCLDNTVGLTDFRLSFQLQALTTSSHIIEWRVDYGVGDSPTIFIPAVATGDLVTGSGSTSNNRVEVDFGNVLDQHPEKVWIRIVNLSPSAGGSGSRPSVAIDDFSLSWTGSGVGSGRPEIIALSPENGERYVATHAIARIEFDREVQKGVGGLYITNESLGRTDTIAVSDPAITVAGRQVLLSGYQWVPASTYHITYDSTAFDSVGFKAYGIYDTNVWRFSIAPEVLTLSSLYETFDDACARAALPDGWMRYNKVGSQQWGCHTAYGITSYRITAYSSGKYQENEDWLISPRLAIPVASRKLWFRQYKRRSGTELEVLWSGDFLGYGVVDSFVWQTLHIPMHPGDTANWHSLSADLSSIPSDSFFLAFRYRSTTQSGYEIRLDSIIIPETPTTFSKWEQPRTGKAYLSGGSDGMPLRLTFYAHRAGRCRITVSDLSGRCVYYWEGMIAIGEQQHTIMQRTAVNGWYVIRLETDGSTEVLRGMVY